MYFAVFALTGRFLIFAFITTLNSCSAFIVCGAVPVVKNSCIFAASVISASFPILTEITSRLSVSKSTSFITTF